jgi:hypothetical protein
MSIGGFLIWIVCSVWLMAAPRSKAVVPLLVGCCYLTLGQAISIGGMYFPAFRLLLLVGLIRVIVRKETIIGGFLAKDKWVFGLGAWVVVASLGHEFVAGSGPWYASGIAFNVIVSYTLFRICISDIDDVKGLLAALALILVPVALLMASELVTRRNAFGVFGGVSYDTMIRDGEPRASGPFRHPILAGTVGAVTFPLFIGLYRHTGIRAVIGIAAALTMVIASNSSGPIMSAIVAGGAVCFWKFRVHTRKLQLGAVIFYILYDRISNLPGYYIIARADMTGSSTGRHRADLIRAAIEHLPEWWFVGTDYTRHWLFFGVSYTDKHVDITNYYLAFGVMSGLAGMCMLIWILWLSFRQVGLCVGEESGIEKEDKFLIWCLGAGMLAHAATSISVSYFDQSVNFFWMNVALIGSAAAAVLPVRKSAEEPADDEEYEGGEIPRYS